MLARIGSCTIVGIEPLSVDVEVDVSPGLPAFEIVGLPGTAVREARERVRTALRNAGFRMPAGRITVNLAPAHLPKSDTLFDLPIALGVLVAAGHLRPAIPLSSLLVVGELSLDGTVRPIRGALCVAARLRRSGRILVLPAGNLAEVSEIPDVLALPVASLQQMVAALGEGIAPLLTPGGAPADRTEVRSADREWHEIRGQIAAKRALEIAAAGGHHLLLIGPPGAGKTSLARALAAVSPELTQDEAMEVTQIHSVAGLLSESEPAVRTRPFRAPHHTVTLAGLLGGGRMPRPGEVSLAHRGFLFLDEFAEFSVRVLEGLRQPLEEGRVTLSRAGGSVTFPASFSLIAATNPCPCGYLGDPKLECTCSETARRQYARRLSGPLLDRIDLVSHVGRPDVDDVLASKSAEEIEAVRERVREARARQERRFASSVKLNGSMRPEEITGSVVLDGAGSRLLREAARRWALSPRALHRVLRVARTIADLNGRETVLEDHVAEALSYRFPTHNLAM